MILEREQQLADLAQLLGDLDSSGGRVVLVRGEAGVGKTALITELITQQMDRAHILLGSCDDLLIPQPLGPLWDVARTEASVAGPLKESDRRGAQEAVLELLSRGMRPTVLVLDDTQWADEATLDAIRFLGRRIDGTNGLLILTYRDGEVDTDHPLRRVIGELPPGNVIRMSLDPLSAEAVASMIVGRGLDLDEVLALTSGNPLFVQEVVASGLEVVPLSVQDSVLARTSKLSPEARLIVDLVSVTPGESERFLVDDILEPAPDQLTECERQGLLRVGPEMLSFHHELARRAVESALKQSDRRRINNRMLSELGDGADPSRLVHHARQAEDIESIVEYAPRAATAAMAIDSHREALAHFRTLEPYLDRIPEADRAIIVEDWARTEFYLDNPGSIDILTRAIELHRSSGDDRALARALTFGVRVYEVNGRPVEAQACSAEAIEILESDLPSSDLAFAASQSGWLAMMRNDFSRAIELADQAISIAERVGDELTTIHSLNTQGTSTNLLRDPHGFSLLEESRRRAEVGGYHFEEVRALINMTSVALDSFEIERGAELALRARNTAVRHEIRVLESYATAHYAQAMEWKGDWVAAEDAATEVLESHPHSAVIALWVLGKLQARRGRPEARATLSRAWSLAEASTEIQNLCPAAAAQAEYMWLTGEDDPGRIARFLQVLDKASRLDAPWHAGSLALWLWKLGRLEDIPSGIAEPYTLTIEGKPMDAAEVWEAKGAPYEQALALMHGNQGARVSALRSFEQLGATVPASRIRRDLLREGVKVPRGQSRSTQEHAAGLTTRQAEVLELLAEGLTNTEIADRLFISYRTVENHVSAILMKLDSPTRDAAADLARDQGLLSTA